MKRTFMSLLALFFPWLVLLIYDNPGGALICLFMQATVLGWPFAAIWAWNTVRSPKKQNTK